MKKGIIALLVLGGALLLAYLFLVEKPADLETSMIPTSVIPLSIGDTWIDVNLYDAGSNGVLFFNMHDDENTAVDAGKEIIKAQGGHMVELSGQGTRLIRFKLGEKEYTVDPNRIFTDEGIKKTLDNYGDYSEEAHQEVRRFVDSLLTHLPVSSLEMLVTLHNNSEGDYSIESYLPGGIYESEASLTAHNPTVDSDDFFFVTDSLFFERLKKRKQNVALQNNSAATDDGSLSVYCGQHGIPYINVEAQHGHRKEQVEMIKMLLEEIPAGPTH